MSTEHNVNRVSSSFDVEAEKAKLEVPVPYMDSRVIPAPPTTNYKRYVDGGTKVEDGGYSTLAINPVIDTEETNKLLEQDPEALKSAWGELTNSVPLIDELLDNPAIQEGIKEQGLQVNEDVIAQFRSLVGGDDLKVFRGQVIRALRHLGVDTKKFFGE